MERYHKIIEHEIFREYMDRIELLEKDRIFCRHNVTHLLDVARIAYIMNLEKGAPYSKDIIYGAALLHDIGKPEQYEEEIPHEITGAKKAAVVLKDCGYEEEEILLIQTAISDHRRGPKGENRMLSELLYEADKKSRMCLFCHANDECNWAEDKKNMRILV